MRYRSTRCADDRTYSFEEAILAGWAEDGGMLLPETIPQVSGETLAAWRGLGYPALCQAILRLFIDEAELPTADLAALVQACSERFGSAEVTPLASCSGAGERTVHVCELWHGPTLAFKDLGMQVLARLLEHFLGLRKKTLNVVVGTSGDTGSSALEAVRGSAHINIVVLYPKGRTSKIQELQMTSIAAANVTVWGVDGTSDDLDIPIAAVFRDVAFKQKHNLGSLNSVNICRVLVQTVHYFYSYLRLTSSPSETVGFSVPTGAGGHITAGMIAQQMGLPVSVLCAATNENDIMHRLISAGDFKQADKVVATNSPSMDIQMPYNCERMFHFLTAGDTGKVKAWMESFETSGDLVPDAVSADDLRAKLRVTSRRVTCDEVLATIKTVWEKDSLLLDPHTAIGVHVALNNAPDPLKACDHVVCMACAHPAKFPATIGQALGMEGQKEVLALMPDQKHACVSKVVGLYGQDIDGRVLQKGEDWEAELRKLLASL